MRSQAMAQGPARKAAVQDCFAETRPDLAKRKQCKQQGDAQGLAGAPLHQFVKKCTVNRGGR